MTTGMSYANQVRAVASMRIELLQRVAESLEQTFKGESIIVDEPNLQILMADRGVVLCHEPAQNLWIAENPDHDIESKSGNPVIAILNACILF